MTHRATFRFLSLLISVFAGVGDISAQSTFQITQLFSNIDGSLQFVELTETAGMNGQHRFAGLTLTSTHNGVVKQYTFPHDLPTDQTAHLSIVVAASDYLKLPVGNINSNYNCCYSPDFATLPIRFLATDGGTVDFAGIDRVTYAGLPVGGRSAIGRGGNIQAATVPRPGGCEPGVPCVVPRYQIAHTYTLAVEYYHASSNRYFLTVSAPDIDALDTGRLRGWQRTGKRLYVAAEPGAYAGMTQPVCRFHIPSSNAHFLSASAEECAQVRARFPDFVLETDAAFYVALPHLVTGSCPHDLDITASNS